MRDRSVAGIVASLIISACVGTTLAQSATPAAQTRAKGTAALASQDFILKVYTAKPAQMEAPKFPATVHAPLQASVLLKAVNDIRKNLKLEPVPVPPPTKVVLTPQVPMVGKNYVATTTFIVSGWGGIQPNLGTLCLAGGWLTLSFETVQGKTYMLDIQLETVGNTPFPLEGAINGEIAMQVVSSSGFVKGHLLGAFTATQAQSSLKIRVEMSRFTSFSRFELLQVD